MRLQTWGGPPVSALAIQAVPPPPPPPQGLANFYTTSFPLTETRISEGGRWIGGFIPGLAWSDCSTSSGRIWGRQQLDVASSFSDGTALLTGTWANDQMVEAVVSINAMPADNYFAECELRLRSTITANVNTGYEISWKATSTPGNAYLIIVRWNGAHGNFTYIRGVSPNSASYALADGDVVRASIIGNTIQAYKNNVLQATVDITSIGGTVYTSGKPGVGFNLEAAGAGHNTDFGYRNVVAQDVIDEPTYVVGVDTLILSENYDRYTVGSPATMTNFSAPRTKAAGTTPQYDVITPGRIGIGNCIHGVITSDPGHTQQSVNWSTPTTDAPGLGLTPPAASATQVFQFWFRISAGGSTAALGTKWFEWWPTVGNQRSQLGIYVNGGATDYLGANVGLKWHFNPSTHECAYQPVHPYWTDVNDGAWHRCTILYKANTTYAYPSPSSRDGIVRLYIDGTKVVDCSQSAVGITPTNGTKVWCTQDEVDQITATQVQHFLYPAVFNGADVGFTMDHDDLMWWVEG